MIHFVEQKIVTHQLHHCQKHATIAKTMHRPRNHPLIKCPINCTLRLKPNKN